MVLEIKGHGIVLGVLFGIYVGRGAFSWIYPSLPNLKGPGINAESGKQRECLLVGFWKDFACSEG